MDVAKENMKFVGVRKDDTVSGLKGMSDPLWIETPVGHDIHFEWSFSIGSAKTSLCSTAL